MAFNQGFEGPESSLSGGNAAMYSTPGSQFDGVTILPGESGAFTARSGDYDPGDYKEIDKAIRHLPGVVAYLEMKAQQLVDATGSENFEVIVQNNPDFQRARAYGAPANNKGIHEELSEHVLLKAALNMEGT